MVLSGEGIPAFLIRQSEGVDCTQEQDIRNKKHPFSQIYSKLMYVQRFSCQKSKILPKLNRGIKSSKS